MKNYRLALSFCVAALCFTPRLSAIDCVSITSAGLTYTQDFDTLAKDGTASTSYANALTIPGWALLETGSSSKANQLYAVDTGASNAGDTYSYGVTGDPHRALGMLQSGTNVPAIGACFKNDTGVSLTGITVSFAGKQVRYGANTGTLRSDSLVFAYSVDATTSLSTGTFTNVDALKYTAPTQPANGVVALPPATVMGPQSVALSVPNGATFWIRWMEGALASGAHDGLAIDDFSLTAIAPGAAGSPVPPSIVGSASPAFANPGASVTLSGTVSSGFNPASSTYAVACDLTPIGGSAAQSAALTGTTWTLSAVVDAGAGPGAKSIACSVSDDLSRTGSTSITVTVQSLADCGKPATSISAIQGTGATSPLAVGSTVTVEAVVVGDFQPTSNGGLSGYFVEDPDGGDPAASRGIFIYDNGFGVAVKPGDRVRVIGKVAEYGTAGKTLTELSAVSSEVVCSSGSAISPVDISLPVATADTWERYEGMLVRITTPLVVTGNYGLGSSGQVALAPSVLFQPTATTQSGSWATQADLNARSLVTLDDGSAATNTNLYPTLYPAGGLSASNTLRLGSRVNWNSTTSNYTPLVGVVDQRGGVYVLQPTETVSFDTTPNPRPDALSVLAQSAIGGRIRIFGGNVHNFFTTLGPTLRGAANQAEYDNQLKKITAELVRADADVYGLDELQNYVNGQPNGGTYTNTPISALVDAMNAATAPGTFAYIDTVNNAPALGSVGLPNGTDAIRNAIVYKPARVVPVGPFATYYQDDQNRPSLAQTFKPATGSKPDLQTFTVVVNHLRSKGSACGGSSDDPYQGNCNGMRLSMANAVASWLNANPTQDPAGANRRLILVGDFNAYLYEDPIQAFLSSSYTDLAASIIGPGGYSYEFASQAGYIDHALANAAANRLVKTIVQWHINADEPAALQAYDSATKAPAAVTAYYAPNEFAASDHDPFVIGFNPLCGDLNDDGVVDAADQAIMRNALGKPKSTVDRRTDLDNDGIISLSDYRLWSQCSAAFAK